MSKSKAIYGDFATLKAYRVKQVLNIYNLFYAVYKIGK